jgi:hemolysin activation/secretion protein
MFHNISTRDDESYKRVTRRACWLAALAIIVAANFSCVRADAAEPVLSAAVIRGSTVYSPAELFHVYREQLGTPITAASTRAILVALDQMYTRDGYARPQTRIDNREVARGILAIDVFEASITRVTFSGDRGPYAGQLDVLAQRLRESRPLRREDVQQALQRMRTLPGLSITVVTRRDETTRNGHELVIQSKFQRVEGVVQASNRGTSEVGRNFLLGQLLVNSMFGHEEKIGVLFAAASDYDEYRGVGMFLDTPLGDGRSRLNAMVFHSDSDPTEDPDLPDLYRRDHATLTLSRPVKSSETLSLSLVGALDLDSLDIDRDGLQIRDDRLRILELETRVTWRRSPATQLAATLELRQGLDALGSGLYDATVSNDPRREDFILLRLQLTWLRRLAEMWTLRVDGFAQQTGYVLPYGERFKIGGDRLGRGFEVPEIAGDQGLGGKIELRRDLTSASSPLGKTQVYGFYDLGATWKQDVGGRESAATAGLGAARQGEKITGYLEVAMPLTHPDVDGRTEPTLFAELSYRF